MMRAVRRISSRTGRGSARRRWRAHRHRAGPRRRHLRDDARERSSSAAGRRCDSRCAQTCFSVSSTKPRLVQSPAQSGQRADRKRPAYQSGRAVTCGCRGRARDARTRRGGRSPRAAASMCARNTRITGRQGLAVVERLRGDLAGVVDPHQGRGVPAGRRVGQGSGTPWSGNGRRHVGCGHGPQTAVDFPDQAVRQAQPAGDGGALGACAHGINGVRAEAGAPPEVGWVAVCFALAGTAGLEFLALCKTDRPWSLSDDHRFRTPREGAARLVRGGCERQDARPPRHAARRPPARQAQAAVHAARRHGRPHHRPQRRQDRGHGQQARGQDVLLAHRRHRRHQEPHAREDAGRTRSA